MKLSSLFSPDHVVTKVRARTFADAVTEILERAEGFRPKIPKSAVLEAVRRREEQSSTAIGLGVAAPHARIAELDDFCILLGLPSAPLEDVGPDGAPIDVVFILVAGNTKNTIMLQSLAGIARFARMEGRLGALRGAKSAEAAWRVIDDSGVEVRHVVQARDLVRLPDVTATTNMTLADLLDLFLTTHAEVVAVLSPQRRILGAVTSAEILEAGFPDYMSRIRDVSFLGEFEPIEQFFRRESEVCVGEVMNREPLIVQADDPMIQVIFKMKQGRHAYAVVAENAAYVGAIVRDDIIYKVLRA